jgi:hypothetical protein
MKKVEPITVARIQLGNIHFYNQLTVKVLPAGFEPATCGLGNQLSIPKINKLLILGMHFAVKSGKIASKTQPMRN